MRLIDFYFPRCSFYSSSYVLPFPYRGFSGVLYILCFFNFLLTCIFFLPFFIIFPSFLCLSRKHLEVVSFFWGFLFLVLTFCSKKEMFQPHLPVRLPCYDLAPVTSFTLGSSFYGHRLQVPPASMA